MIADAPPLPTDDRKSEELLSRRSGNLKLSHHPSISAKLGFSRLYAAGVCILQGAFDCGRSSASAAHCLTISIGSEARAMYVSLPRPRQGLQSIARPCEAVRGIARVSGRV